MFFTRAVATVTLLALSSLSAQTVAESPPPREQTTTHDPESTTERTPQTSCKLKGCHPVLGYHADDPCQCDEQCTNDGSCCDDYASQCIKKDNEDGEGKEEGAGEDSASICPEGYRGTHCQALSTCTPIGRDSSGNGPCLHGKCVTTPLTCQSWCTSHANGGGQDALGGPYAACMVRCPTSSTLARLHGWQ